MTTMIRDITEQETNRAFDVFAQHWAVLPFTVQDSLTDVYGRAVKVARFQVWTANSRSAYAVSQTVRGEVIALAAAITRHITGAVVYPPTV